MDNISHHLNNLKIYDLIEKEDWININTNLNNSTIEKMKFKFTHKESFFGHAINELTNVDVSAIITNLLKNEIHTSILKKINKKLFDTRHIDYIDIRPKKLSNHDHNLSDCYKKILGIIMYGDYRNLITNALIASMISESEIFLNHPINQQVQISVGPYTIGKISNCNVYVDPHLQYGDDRICLFNTDINTSEMIVYYNNIDQYIEIKYDLSINSNSHLIKIVDGENKDTLKEYIPLHRESIINRIIPH